MVDVQLELGDETGPKDYFHGGYCSFSEGDGCTNMTNTYICHICPKDYFHGWYYSFSDGYAKTFFIFFQRITFLDSRYQAGTSQRKEVLSEACKQGKSVVIIGNFLFCDQYSRPNFVVSASHYQLNKLIIGLVPENLTFMKACIVDGMDFEKLTNQKQFENKLDMDIKLQFSKTL